MNESNPNASIHSKNKPNLYRIAVVALLFLILLMQTLTFVSEQARGAKSADCRAAIAAAQKATDAVPDQLRSMLDDYDQAIYTDAENLPQQTFRAQEYIFLTLQQIAIQNQAVNQVALACQ